MVQKNVSEKLPVRTQFIVFTLFGDFILPNGGKIWTSSILHLLGLLDISERAVRSTLSRMSRKGWIKPRKHGRRSEYILTPRGQALLEAGQARIFEPLLEDWNEEWFLVVYSLPEKRRKKRHALRKQLTWLGFGSLAPGTWISPHNRNTELQALFSDMAIEPYVEQFSGIHLGPSSAEDLVQRCWDLETLESQYQDFIDRYQPKYEADRSASEGKGSIEPRNHFITRFWMTHEFTSVPYLDPNLPPDLLPGNWAGFQARNLLENYRQLLGESTSRYVRDVMNGDCGTP